MNFNWKMPNRRMPKSGPNKGQDMWVRSTILVDDSPFWEHYKDPAKKEIIKKHGLSVRKWDNMWQISQWEPYKKGDDDFDRSHKPKIIARLNKIVDEVIAQL